MCRLYWHKHLFIMLALSYDFTFLFFWLCVQDWDQCEKRIAASHEKLRDFKQKLSVPLPDHHEELHTEQIRCKVHQLNLTHLVSFDLLDARCFSNIWVSFLLFELKYLTISWPDLQWESDRISIVQIMIGLCSLLLSTTALILLLHASCRMCMCVWCPDTLLNFLCAKEGLFFTHDVAERCVQYSRRCVKVTSTCSSLYELDCQQESLWPCLRDGSWGAC